MYRSSPCNMGTLFCSVCGGMCPLGTNPSEQSVCHVCRANLVPSRDGGGALVGVAADGWDTPSETSFLEHRHKKWADAPDNDDKTSPTQEDFCEKCGDLRVCWFRTQQTRSADEGHTVFMECTVCHTKWRIDT